MSIVVRFTFVFKFIADRKGAEIQRADGQRVQQPWLCLIRNSSVGWQVLTESNEAFWPDMPYSKLMVSSVASKSVRSIQTRVVCSYRNNKHDRGFLPDQSLACPVMDRHDSSIMTLPDRYRPFRGQTPYHDPAITVAGGQQCVARVEVEGVDGGLVATLNVRRHCWALLHDSGWPQPLNILRLLCRIRVSRAEYIVERLGINGHGKIRMHD